MRRFLAALLLLGFAVQAPAQELFANADRIAIRATIESQIAAFRKDDAETAFSFASPQIQAVFGSPTTFIEMVRQSYPQVYRPELVAFGDLYDDAGRTIQLVGLVGTDGRTVAAAYEMQRQSDGTWRINGCQLLQLPERST